MAARRNHREQSKIERAREREKERNAKCLLSNIKSKFRAFLLWLQFNYIFFSSQTWTPNRLDESKAEISSSMRDFSLRDSVSEKF